VYAYIVDLHVTATLTIQLVEFWLRLTEDFLEAASCKTTMYDYYLASPNSGQHYFAQLALVSHPCHCTPVELWSCFATTYLLLRYMSQCCAMPYSCVCNAW
jgi:hypothetical protein